MIPFDNETKLDNVESKNREGEDSKNLLVFETISFENHYNHYNH